MTSLEPVSGPFQSRVPLTASTGVAASPLLLPPPFPHPAEGPGYLLLQPVYPLLVGPLPRLQRALCLHLGLRAGRLVRGLALCVCARVQGDVGHLPGA